MPPPVSGEECFVPAVFVRDENGECVRYIRWSSGWSVSGSIRMAVCCFSAGMICGFTVFGIPVCLCLQYSGVWQFEVGIPATCGSTGALMVRAFVVPVAGAVASAGAVG